MKETSMHLRLSITERAAISEAAIAANRTVSDFVRLAALEKAAAMREKKE